jgi:hypothetical protein
VTAQPAAGSGAFKHFDKRDAGWTKVVLKAGT